MRIESTSSTIEVVAQVIEAEFVVGAVRDVGSVRGALFVGGLAGLHHADGHAEEAVDRPHPVRVALGQVFVDGDDVRAFAGQRVQVRSERRDQRLAFAGAHLGDFALVQHHAADELHVEVTQAERAARGFAHHGKSFGQDIVHCLARGELVAELLGLRCELLVGERLQGRFERVDLLDDAGVLTDEPLVAATENASKPIGHRGSVGGGRGKTGHFTGSGSAELG
jgi:hypothetical protein